ncbi:hypothetical protein [Pontibacter fetidus]|uniref:Lipoprotein n=1 Tax=Pontibacter fetidus TaxID=2700082 RepID=A0A6B2H0Y9_9BACT|nr:hypothetical protein [Pontibacter fetidus]NDK55788.1 hypothetical protein [Pontibacter fetidus]
MRFYLVVLVAVSLLFSCTHQHNEEAGHSKVHAAQSELSLNGTERWQADAATNENIQQLQQLMQDHLRQPDANDLEVVNELSNVLQLGFDEVFKECRMEGPEHDMLHVYLVPMLDDVKAMNTTDQKAAVTARDQLASRLDEYQTYFK